MWGKIGGRVVEIGCINYYDCVMPFGGQSVGHLSRLCFANTVQTYCHFGNKWKSFKVCEKALTPESISYFDFHHPFNGNCFLLRA